MLQTVVSNFLHAEQSLDLIISDCGKCKSGEPNYFLPYIYFDGKQCVQETHTLCNRKNKIWSTSTLFCILLTSSIAFIRALLLYYVRSHFRIHMLHNIPVAVLCCVQSFFNLLYIDRYSTRQWLKLVF